MGVTNYTKMIDQNGDVVSVELDRVQRFLDQGWTMVDQPSVKKESPRKGKNRIVAEAQVTSNEVEEEWDPLTGEEWADSVESVYAPEGEQLKDFETANKED